MGAYSQGLTGSNSADHFGPKSLRARIERESIPSRGRDTGDRGTQSQGRPLLESPNRPHRRGAWRLNQRRKPMKKTKKTAKKITANKKLAKKKKA